jgi:O-glycosyl hydrolase
LRQARSLAKNQVFFYANPHSPPGWMKANDSMMNWERDGCVIGYCARDRGDHRDDYARYLVDFVEAYGAAGVPIDAISPLNEPDARTDYPGAMLAAKDEADLVHRVKRLMAAHDPPLQQDVWVGDRPEYGEAVMQHVARPDDVDGLSYHCYFLNRSDLDTYLAKYPTQTLHETECTEDFDPNVPWPSPIDLLIQNTKHHASSVATWNLALDSHGGPRRDACEDRLGPCVTKDDDDSTMTAPVIIDGAAGEATVRFQRGYYELGHFTKFVRPGARRVATTDAGDITTAGFVNRDGSTVLVVHNRAATAASFTVNVDGTQSFPASLPADGIATYVWKA